MSQQRTTRIFSVSNVGLFTIIIVFAIAFLTLAGHVLNLRILETFHPYWTPMRVITALCLIMAGFALMLLRREPMTRNAERWTTALGIIICVVGSLTLADYLVEFFSRGPWLFGRAPILSLFLAPDARMAVITSALFVLYGFAVALLASGPRAEGIGHGLLMLVSLAVYLVMIGYVLNIPALYTQMSLGIAFNTDLAFFCLCLAGFCIRPGTWLMNVFTSEGAGGVMTRRMLPWLLALPLVIGWLRLGGERLGLFSSAVGVALVAATYTVCFLWLLWLSARSVNRTDLLRRKAEEGLAFQAHLLENVHDAVIGLSADYVINYWNESAKEIYGWTAEEAIGKKSFEILQTVYAGGTMEEVAERIRREGRTAYEATHRTKDGRVLNVDVHSTLVRDSAGNITGYVSLCRDITDRKKAEEALRSNRDLLDEMGKIAKIGAWELDTATMKQEWTDETYAIHDRERGSYDPNSTEEISRFEPGSKTLMEKAFGEAIGKGKPYDLEAEMTTVKRNRKWVRAVCVPAVEHGKVTRLRGSVQDITPRKKAEEALRRSEARWNAAIESFAEGAIIATEDEQVIYWNPAAREMHGFTGADEGIGPLEKTPATFQLWTPDGGHMLELDEWPMRRIKRGEAVRGLELRIRRPDQGWEKIFSYSGTMVDTAGGERLIFLTCHDLTKLRAAEEELKKSHGELEARVAERTAELRKTTELVEAERRRFREVLDQLPAYVILLTPDYHVAFDNRFFRERFGEHHGRKCHEYLFGRQEPCETCETYTVLKSGKPHHWEWTGPDKRNYDIYDFPFKDVDGSSLIMEVGLDITEQKWLADELRVASRYNRNLLEASLDPLVTISPDGKVTDVNMATELATGLSRELLVGTNFSDYFTDPSKASEGYRKVLADGFVRDYPLSLRHSSGSVIDVLYNATVYKNEAGEVQGVFAAARDITAKKAAEAELGKYRLHLEELVKLRTVELEKANAGLKSEVSLREKIAEDLKMSNQDLEQFAYAASHDLQEPLRAIAGFVELLKQQLEASLDAKKKEYMDFIVDGVGRMQSLINGLLEYSRVETRGKAPVQVDAKTALDRALLNLRAAIQESGASIAADSLPQVNADQTQLAQLFQNLIGNAIKFHSAAAPRISVSAERDNGAWKFAVADNGIGIEPQYAERIFMIFQRLHTRKHYPGTGIGLAICKRIVERHGGRIWVESTPGNGSTFYFSIPDKGEERP